MTVADYFFVLQRLSQESRDCSSADDPGNDLSVARHYTEHQCRAECLDGLARCELGCHEEHYRDLLALLKRWDLVGDFGACNGTEADIRRALREKSGVDTESCGSCLRACDKMEYETR